MINPLLLEIGTEEIPAGYIEPALAALSRVLQERLAEARIDHGEARVFGTPRRLAILIEAVADRQKPLTTEVTGPPAKVGFDPQGKPTVAAHKFAEKLGISVKNIKITDTPKGSYLAARITERGLATLTLLKTILPEVIAALPFPKTMRWSDYHTAFARPVHSLLAVLGGRVVAFTLEDIKSGRYTWGHAFLKPGRIKISQPSEYLERLEAACVLADIAKRRSRVKTEIEALAAELGGRILPDEELLTTVTHLIEFPAPVAGRFDTKFLELPDEVLITSMREHQKYFAVVDASGRLMPHFIAVNNTAAKDPALVARGHQRVLRARLEDAMFFYRSDLKAAMEDWVAKLEGVLFQARLGSMHAKVLRVQALAETVAGWVDPAGALRAEASRAAHLCKADLVSQMVVEFPKLQGVMGRVYAVAAGEPEGVAAAIQEHYRPTASGGALPQTKAGAVVSIADKMDSICGCFRVGLVPTGGSDPYALRRQGIGIVQIMRDQGLSFSLGGLIAAGLSPYAGIGQAPPAQTAEQVYAFLRSRMAYLLTEEGLSKDVVAAVVDASADDVPDVWERARALEALKAAPDFEPLAIAFKRVVNIMKKAGLAALPAEAAAVVPERFEHACEGDLLKAYQTVKAEVARHQTNRRTDLALRAIASLRGAVDAFFDGVMVMADDPAIRGNRFALLALVAGLFENIADFSKIST